jgi:hypothetical protein
MNNILNLIEDDDFLNIEEKNLINEEILSNTFPWYWQNNQLHNDSIPFLSHILKDRNNENINSSYFDFFLKILFKFCKKNNLECSKIYRACLNLNWYGNKQSSIHKDYDFDHKQFILYLSNPNNGNTFIYDENKNLIRTIKASQFKGVCFNNFYHSAGLPDKDRRVIAVFCFN